jgi:hypothetical protein
MRKYNNFLPSAQARWCTINMKLKPFEEWIEEDLKKGVEIFTYVGIRYDERGRVGYKPTNPLLKSKFPFIGHKIEMHHVMTALTDQKSVKHLCHIKGKRGTGKTRFMKEVAYYLYQRGKFSFKIQY